MGAGQAKEEWVSFRIGANIPPNALIAGSIKGEKIFVGRLYHSNKGLLMVGYYESKKQAFTSINGRLQEIFTAFELLTGHGHVWVSTLDFKIPVGAVAVGVNSEGHTLYVGRVRSLDKRDKSQHTQLVSVNPNIKTYGRVDMNLGLTILDNTCQILVEAPGALKLSDADLQASRTSSITSTEEKVLSVSRHLVNQVKSGIALIVHNAKYNVAAPDMSRLRLQAQEDEKKCCICLAVDKDALFLPCRHVCCCFDCGEGEKNRTSKCPLCRNTVSQVLKVFF